MKVIDTNKEVAFVFGGAGFIGHHLARRLKQEGKFVIVFDIKTSCEFTRDTSYYDIYEPIDLSKDSDTLFCYMMYYRPKEVYQLACLMGGAGFIFTGDNDFDIMTNSAAININLLKVLQIAKLTKQTKVFYSSSACMYPSHNQEDPNNPLCSEESAYPANPDSEYGWEKLFSERLYLSAHRNKGLAIRIARFHNIFGPEGTYIGGKEKAPAAICRKVIQSDGTVDVWGPGTQTRSFLYIDECVEGILRLMKSDFMGPVNIGSTEMVSINELVELVASIEGKNITIKNIPGPVGVAGRNSDNTLIKEKLGWEPDRPLKEGLIKTYQWIKDSINGRL